MDIDHDPSKSSGQPEEISLTPELPVDAPAVVEPEAGIPLESLKEAHHVDETNEGNPTELEDHSSPLESSRTPESLDAPPHTSKESEDPPVAAGDPTPSPIKNSEPSYEGDSISESSPCPTLPVDSTLVKPDSQTHVSNSQAELINHNISPSRRKLNRVWPPIKKTQIDGKRPAGVFRKKHLRRSGVFENVPDESCADCSSLAPQNPQKSDVSTFESEPTASLAFIRASDKHETTDGQTTFESTPACVNVDARTAERKASLEESTSIFENEPLNLIRADAVFSETSPQKETPTFFESEPSPIDTDSGYVKPFTSVEGPATFESNPMFVSVDAQFSSKAAFVSESSLPEVFESSPGVVHVAASFKCTSPNLEESPEVFENEPAAPTSDVRALDRMYEDEDYYDEDDDEDEDEEEEEDKEGPTHELAKPIPPEISEKLTSSEKTPQKSPQKSFEESIPKSPEKSPEKSPLNVSPKSPLNVSPKSPEKSAAQSSVKCSTPTKEGDGQTSDTGDQPELPEVRDSDISIPEDDYVIP